MHTAQGLTVSLRVHTGRPNAHTRVCTNTHWQVAVPETTWLSGPVSMFPVSSSRVGSGIGASACSSRRRNPQQDGIRCGGVRLHCCSHSLPPSAAPPPRQTAAGKGDRGDSATPFGSYSWIHQTRPCETDAPTGALCQTESKSNKHKQRVIDLIENSLVGESWVLSTPFQDEILRNAVRTLKISKTEKKCEHGQKLKNK